MMELGQRLKQARLEVGLSQRQLCGEHLTRNMLSQIENGSALPSMNTLSYLAGRLGRPISFFLEEETASPNQARILEARAAFVAGEYVEALSKLQEYKSPDSVFDPEYYLLRSLCCIHLAETQADTALLAEAAESGSQTPYYTKDLERRRLLAMADAAPDQVCLIVQELPSNDRELLLRARDALAKGDTIHCAALLDAADDCSCIEWLILRGDCAVSAGDDTEAIRHYQQAEYNAGSLVHSKLEQCYLRSGDYKMAYHYACKQR